MVYRWNSGSRQFEETQRITTTGAYDWTHFALDGYHFLAVANSFSGPPARTTFIKSVVYFWQDGRFIPFQTIEVCSLVDRASSQRVDWGEPSNAISLWRIAKQIEALIHIPTRLEQN